MQEDRCLWSCLRITFPRHSYSPLPVFIRRHVAYLQLCSSDTGIFLIPKFRSLSGNLWKNNMSKYFPSWNTSCVFSQPLQSRSMFALVYNKMKFSLCVDFTLFSCWRRKANTSCVRPFHKWLDQRKQKENSFIWSIWFSQSYAGVDTLWFSCFPGYQTPTVDDQFFWKRQVSPDVWEPARHANVTAEGDFVANFNYSRCNQDDVMS